VIYEATNKRYKKRMRKIRKRDQNLDKLSNDEGSTTGQSTEAAAAHQMKKSNFLEDIQ
jgi:hypothetical protein